MLWVERCLNTYVAINNMHDQNFCRGMQVNEIRRTVIKWRHTVTFLNDWSSQCLFSNLEGLYAALRNAALSKLDAVL